MKKTFWMFLEIELTDLLPRFEKVFQVSNLYQDNENVWEWLQSKNRWEKTYLNISRSHDQEKGNYNEPINIFVEHNFKESINVDEIGKKLFKEFKTAIYYGELKIETRDRENYLTTIEKTFS